VNKYKTIAINTAYVTLGTIGSKLIYIFMLPLYTRWLSTSEFGAADTITTYVDILITIIFLNIADAIFVYPRNVDNDKKSEYFSSGCFFMLCMSLFFALFLLISQFASGIIPQENVFFKYKWLIFLLMVSRYCQNFTQSFIRSLDKMALYSISGVVLTISIALFSFLLIPNWGVRGYVYAIIIAQVVTTIYTSFRGHIHTYFSVRKIMKKPLIEMLSYSLPLAPNSIMWWLITGLNRPIMENKLGLAAIGIYAVASKISGVINSLTSFVGLAWGNSVLDEYQKEGFNIFYNNYLRIISTFYFFMGFLLILLSKPIVMFFTTPEFYDAYKYVPILALGLIFSGVSSCIGSIFAAVKQSKYFFYSSIFGGAIAIISITAFVSFWGLMGVSVSLMLSFLAILIARWYYGSKFTSFTNKSYYFTLVIIFLLVYFADIYISSNLKYLLDLFVFSGVVYYSRKDFMKMIKVIVQK